MKSGNLIIFFAVLLFSSHKQLAVTITNGTNFTLTIVESNGPHGWRGYYRYPETTLAPGNTGHYPSIAMIKIVMPDGIQKFPMPLFAPDADVTVHFSDNRFVFTPAALQRQLDAENGSLLKSLTPEMIMLLLLFTGIKIFPRVALL